MMQTPLQVYQVALIQNDDTVDVTEIDARSNDEAFDLAKTVFGERGFEVTTEEMEIISIESAVSLAVREFLEEKDNPFKILNQEIAYPVLVDYVEGLLTWEHPSTILDQVLESDEEIEVLTNRIVSQNHLMEI
ncbi:MAG TPA: hypothetical protein VFC84_02190 [Desulfosporosinus sp.]|nr:hypothetical protein [Desulfosporosinus sp.]